MGRKPPASVKSFGVKLVIAAPSEPLSKLRNSEPIFVISTVLNRGFSAKLKLTPRTTNTSWSDNMRLSSSYWFTRINRLYYLIGLVTN